MVANLFDEDRHQIRTRGPVCPESERVCDPSPEIVRHVPNVLLRIAEPFQLLDRMRREVRLDADQRGIIIHPEAIHLPGVLILVVLVPESRDLMPVPVVDDLRDKIVAALSGSIAADHIRNALHGLLVYQAHAAGTFLELDVRHTQSVVSVYKLSRHDRADVQVKLVLDLLSVKHRLSRDAPLAQTVHRILVWVREFELFQHLPVFRRKKPVVEIRRFVGRDVRRRPVEKAALEPVRHGYRVERDDDLFVVFRLAAHTAVKLGEVRLLDLGRFLDPHQRYAVDRFQLFRIVQSGEDELGARVLNRYDKIALVRRPLNLRVILGELTAKLLKAGISKRPRDLSCHENPVVLLRYRPLDQLASGEDRLTRTGAAHQYQIARLAEEQRQKRLVVCFAKIVPPLRYRVLPVEFLLRRIIDLPRRQLLPGNLAPSLDFLPRLHELPGERFPSLDLRLAQALSLRSAFLAEVLRRFLRLFQLVGRFSCAAQLLAADALDLEPPLVFVPPLGALLLRRERTGRKPVLSRAPSRLFPVL